MSVLEAAPTTTPLEQRSLMGSAYDLSEATTASEARTLAGLDWEAVHAPLSVDLSALDDHEDDTAVPVAKERAVVRSDSGEMFGVVGREHKILTNEELFSFASTLLTEAGLTWATCEPFGGSMGGGKQPFVGFRLGEDIEVAGLDAVGCLALLSNGHVGNTACILNVTPWRYRCSNVVTPVIRAGKKGQNIFTYSIQHSGDLTAKILQAQEALSVTTAAMREMESLANRMAAVDMDLAAFEDFLTDLVPLSTDAGDRARKTVEDTRGAFRQNWRDTLTLDPALKATRWGALNVVTEIIDHGSLDVRSSKTPAAERRMRSVHFGTGAALRNRAYALLGGVG